MGLYDANIYGDGWRWYQYYADDANVNAYDDANIYAYDDAL